MSEKERLEEVAALFKEYDRKLEEAEAIKYRLQLIINPTEKEVRKKSARRPQDYLREVLQ